MCVCMHNVEDKDVLLLDISVHGARFLDAEYMVSREALLDVVICHGLVDGDQDFGFKFLLNLEIVIT